VKLQIELEAMLDTKFRLLKDNIQTHIENRILGFKIHLHKMEDEIEELEKENNQPKRERVKQIST
jgi:hypothetical protein